MSRSNTKQYRDFNKVNRNQQQQYFKLAPSTTPMMRLFKS